MLAIAVLFSLAAQRTQSLGLTVAPWFEFLTELLYLIAVPSLLALLILGPFRPHTEFSWPDSKSELALILLTVLAALFALYIFLIYLSAMALGEAFRGMADMLARVLRVFAL